MEGLRAQVKCWVGGHNLTLAYILRPWYVLCLPIFYIPDMYTKCPREYAQVVLKITNSSGHFSRILVDKNVHENSPN